MTAPTDTQNLSNHARFVPGFHFFTGSIVIGIFGWSFYRLATAPSSDTILGALTGVVLLGMFWYIRTFPLKVQDRVIRLEERLRIARLLPADMQAKCESLTASQLIALRFASDAELPALVKKVIDERIVDRKTIKSMITTWRPDHMRM